MNLIKMYITKLIYRNLLHFCKLKIEEQKEKLRKQSHLPSHHKEKTIPREKKKKKTFTPKPKMPMKKIDFPDGSEDKESVFNAGDPGSIPGLGKSSGERNASHFTILAWRIPWTEEPGRLQSMGSQRKKKKVTQPDGKIYHVLRLKESILSK